jgi:hypothetical protein
MDEVEEGIGEGEDDVEESVGVRCIGDDEGNVVYARGEEVDAVFRMRTMKGEILLISTDGSYTSISKELDTSVVGE